MIRCLVRLVPGILPIVFLQGCGSPNFDLPDNGNGPTLSTITQRITCELAAMVADHPNKNDEYKHKEELLSLNYKMAATLSLDVTDSGELAPNFNYPPTELLSINAGLKFSRSRTRNITVNLAYSFKDLHTQLKANKAVGYCPNVGKTNLAGDLGLQSTVSLALTAANRDVSLDQKGGEFGGSVNFVVERNVNSFGPTWDLVHFKGPGSLAEFGRKNTDQLTFAFARAPTEPSTQVGPGDISNADALLKQLLLADVARARSQ